MNIYRVSAAISWQINSPSSYSVKTPLNGAHQIFHTEVPEVFQAHVTHQFYQLEEIEIMKPNEADPSSARYAIFPDVFIVPTDSACKIIGTGNIVSRLEPQLRAEAWIDYNSAKQLRVGLGDKIWIRLWNEKSDGFLIFQYHLRGILKPYSEINMASPPALHGLVLLEEGNVTDQLMSALLYSSNSTAYKATYQHVLLGSSPENAGSYAIASKWEKVQMGFVYLISPHQREGLLTFVIASVVLIVVLTYKETSRVINKLLYPASVLIAMGISPVVIKIHVIFLQYVCFITTSLLASLVLKFFLFHYFSGYYLNLGLVFVNIFFWLMLFTLALIIHLPLRKLLNLSILTMGCQRGDVAV